MQRLPIILILFFVIHSLAFAAGDVEVRVQPSVLLPGQKAFLEIEVPDNTLSSMPVFPAVDGLKIDPQNANRVRRDRETRVVFYSILTPSKAGIITIPALTLASNSTTPLVTNPVDITVLTEEQIGPPPPANRKLHALLLTPKDTFVTGEQFPLQALILVDRSVNLQNLDQPKMPKDGYAIDRFENPIRGDLNYAGRLWQSFAFTARATPVASGDNPLGPLEITATIAVPEENNNSPFQRFRNFRLSAKSEPKILKILPFPENAPDGFDGTVGQFTLEAAFDPAPTRADDPVAIRLAVRGIGDPAQVSLPRIADESAWEFFEGSREEAPRSSTSLNSEVSFRRILRPRGSIGTEIPPFLLVFFNPKTNSYETASSKPLVLPKLAPSTAVGSADTSSQIAGPTSATRSPLNASPALASVVLEPQNLLLTIPSPHARWLSPRPWTTTLSWIINIIGVTLLLAFLAWRWQLHFASTEAGKIAAVRKSLRKQLHNIAADPQPESRCLEAARWLESWQISPLARPLTDQELLITKVFRSQLERLRYAPEQGKSEALSPLALLPLLKPAR